MLVLSVMCWCIIISLFVAQIVRTANEMSSTDNGTPTNKSCKIKTNRDMIKLNSDKGREVISNYISALNGDSEAIKWANDKRKTEYDTYDDELKDSVDKCFDCI